MDNNSPLTTESIQQPNPNLIAVPPTPVMPSFSQEPEKKSSKMLYVLLAGIIIALLTGGAFYLGKSSNNKTTKTNTVVPTPKPTKIVDETTDWKIYTNEVGRYSVKYPSNYKLLDGEIGSTDGVIVPAKDTIELVTSSPVGLALIISFKKLPKTISLEQAVDENSWCMSITSSQSKSYATAGKKALIFEDNPCGLAGSTDIYFLNDDILYHVQQPSGSASGHYEEVEPYIKKILDTFQFLPVLINQNINQNQVDTSNWKTYQIENISFKLPTDWTGKTERAPADGFAEVFENPDKKFIFIANGAPNWNPFTGGSYNTIDEYIDMPLVFEKIIIDGQEGRVLPRAGSENINEIVFFSKDAQFIYHLSLQTGTTSDKTPVSVIQEGQKIFGQILSTFKFLP